MFLSFCLSHFFLLESLILILSLSFFQVLRLFPSGSVGPLLTFVPVRLGISSVNKIYIPLLKVPLIHNRFVWKFEH